MIPSETNDWSEELKPEAVQFLRSSAKEIAILVANADNMARFRSRITEVADIWTRYRIAEQAEQDGTWQPSMGTPENPLDMIWSGHLNRPGPAIHAAGWLHVRGTPLGCYALLQAVHDHVLPKYLPKCERIDDGCVPQELSDEIWRRIVTYPEGESNSHKYVNTGLINWAMGEVKADLQNGVGKQEETQSETSGTEPSAVITNTPKKPAGATGRDGGHKGERQRCEDHQYRKLDCHHAGRQCDHQH